MIRFSLFLWLWATTPLLADETVPTVDAQPLIAQVQRLQTQLKTYGTPLPDETSKILLDLKADQGDEKISAIIQKQLDPLVAMVIEIPEQGVPKILKTRDKLELVEQGWRSYIIKIINRAESKATLRIDSPSAYPVPNGPKDQVENRWLGLMLSGAPPLLPNLSGLQLEYAVVHCYSRDVGSKSAKVAFWTEAKPSRVPPKDLESVEMTFEAKPSVPVTFRVLDEEGEPTMAAFLITDSVGRVYPLQAKRLAPDFFFHPQVYRSTGEQVRLPAGEYTIRCSRGPESIPEVKLLVVKNDPVTFLYQVQRWIDPAKSNWWSGDHHIHAAGCAHYENPTEGVEPKDMMRHVLGEDLKMGCCLTWGPCFDYQKRFFTGKPDAVSQPPYYLRYDVEVSGFGSHASGHLNLLNLQEQLYPGGKSKLHWPTLGMNTLRWAKLQGGITGPAHSGSGLTRFVDEIPNAPAGPYNLPNFKIPAYDGIGANEFIVDVTHQVSGPDGKLVPAIDFISAMDTDRVAEWNIWYHVLNCGFRTRVSGETDFPCISGERVGMGRVYVKVDGKLNFESWVRGLQSGRSYVSDGTTHLIDFTLHRGDKKLEVGVQGSEFQLAESGKLKFTVRAAAKFLKQPEVPVELIVNGYPVQKSMLKTDGKIQELTFETEIKKSSWVALRVFPSAHTNPFFVIVDRQPIRANRLSAEWCLRGVEQCWKSKEKTYAKEEIEQAKQDYDHARTVYQKLLEEMPKEK